MAVATTEKNSPPKSRKPKPVWQTDLEQIRAITGWKLTEMKDFDEGIFNRIMREEKQMIDHAHQLFLKRERMFPYPLLP